MATAVKILKTILILALIVAVILVFWYGILGAKAKVDIPVPEPASLGLYPTDLVNTPGWEPNFSLVDFIEGDKVTWGSSVEYFQGEFGEESGGKEVYSGSNSDKIDDAINLIRIADYNEKDLPFFSYFTDAGGSADIAGKIKGNLMSQTIHVQQEKNYFHQNINAIVQDPDFPMAAATVTLAEGILNKAKRQIDYGDYFYVLEGASPLYLFGEDLVDEDGEVVLIDGKPTEFDDGRCSANWDAATKKGLKTPRELPKDLTPDKEFSAKFGNKYIMSLNPADYSNPDLLPYKWFDANKTSIEKIYVDENGEPADSKTDHWYIRVVATANLPERPASGSLDKWVADCQSKPINESLSMENPNYVKGKDKNGKDVDFTPAVINNLEHYTGASGVCFTALKYTYEIWDCGVMKSWRTDEGWYGTLVGFTGDVQPFNPTTYTYNQEYCKIENFFDYLKIDPETV